MDSGKAAWIMPNHCAALRTDGQIASAMNVVTHGPLNPGATTTQRRGQRERAHGRARSWGRRPVASPRHK
eukprot:2227569-Alexandrium_andersonii.AAC.1